MSKEEKQSAKNCTIEKTTSRCIMKLICVIISVITTPLFLYVRHIKPDGQFHISGDIYIQYTQIPSIISISLIYLLSFASLHDKLKNNDYLKFIIYNLIFIFGFFTIISASDQINLNNDIKNHMKNFENYTSEKRKLDDLKSYIARKRTEIDEYQKYIIVKDKPNNPCLFQEGLSNVTKTHITEDDLNQCRNYMQALDLRKIFEHDHSDPSH